MDNAVHKLIYERLCECTNNGFVGSELGYLLCRGNGSNKLSG